MLNQLLKNKFARNVILVASGTAGAQVITMAFAPIITRLYGPESFGLLGVFLAVLAVMTPVAALTYPIAIVLPQSDNEARGLARLSFLLTLLVALITAVAFIVAGDEISSLLGIEIINDFLLFIPLAMFFSGLQQIIQQWLIRKKMFSITARIAVSQSLIVNLTKAGLGWFYPFGSFLIILSTLGNALHAMQLWFGAKKWGKREESIERQISNKFCLKKIAYMYRDFPYYRAPQVFINALSQSLPMLMLASFFGPTSAGFYAIGRTVLAMPSMLLGKAVADVFYPKIAELANQKKQLHQPILKATLVLAIIGIIPYGLIMLFGPWLFKFVFGAEWSSAGEYAQWLAVWLYMAFMNRPAVATLAVLKLQHVFLIYEVVSLTLRAISLYMGFALLASDLYAVIMFSLVSALLNLALIVVTLLKGKSV